MRRLLKEMVILGFTAIAGIYLINPTAGILEFVPDNLPLIGNLDEAAAVLIILSTLRYYGLDLTRLYKRDDPAQVPGKGEWTPYTGANQPPQNSQYSNSQTVNPPGPVTVEREEDYQRRSRS